MTNDEPFTPADVTQFVNALFKNTPSAEVPDTIPIKGQLMQYQLHKNCSRDMGNTSYVIRQMFHDMHNLEPEYFLHAIEHFVNDVIDIAMALGAYHALDDLKDGFDDELSRGTSAFSSCRCEDKTHQAVHEVFNNMMSMIIKIVQRHKTAARYVHDKTTTASPFIAREI